MSNIRGRGSVSGGRPEEPPSGSVLQLHDEEPAGSNGDEWYEKERLVGQITGGARTLPLAPDEPELAFRLSEAPRGPNAFNRLRRRIGQRRSRVLRGVTETVGRARRERHRQPDDDSTPGRQPGGRLEAFPSHTALGSSFRPDSVAQGDAATAPVSNGADEASIGRLAWRSPATAHSGRPVGLRRSAVALALAAPAIAAVALGVILLVPSGKDSTDSPGPGFRAAVSTTGVALTAAAGSLTGVLGSLEEKIRAAQTHQRATAKRRHPRHLRRRPLPRHAKVAVSQPQAAESSAPASSDQGASSTASGVTHVVAAPQPSVPSASSSPPPSSSSGSTSGTSPVGSTGSQTGSSSEHSSSSGGSGSTSKQPAFGPSGALGPGSGAPGTQ